MTGLKEFHSGELMEVWEGERLEEVWEGARLEEAWVLPDTPMPHPLCLFQSAELLPL